MKKNIFSKLALATALGTTIITPSKAQDKKDSEQQKIDILYKKLGETKNISTCVMPDSLQPVQDKYNALRAKVDKQFTALDSLEKTNWNMYLRAYDDFAVRIGKNFQLSKYFKPWELVAIKQMIQKSSVYKSGDYVQQKAYVRIMNNSASLADLLEFYSDIDFNVTRQYFETKFLPKDSFDRCEYYSSLSPVVFINNDITKDMNRELMLLSDTWASDYVDKQIYFMDVKRNKSISLLHGTCVASQTKQINEMYQTNKDKFVADFIAENSGLDMPNFRIPEMKKIKTQYLKNDMQIKSFFDQYQELYAAEERLETFIKQERQILTDSLNVLLGKRTQRSK